MQVMNVTSSRGFGPTTCGDDDHKQKYLRACVLPEQAQRAWIGSIITSTDRRRVLTQIRLCSTVPFYLQLHLWIRGRTGWLTQHAATRLPGLYPIYLTRCQMQNGFLLCMLKYRLRCSLTPTFLPLLLLTHTHI